MRWSSIIRSSGSWACLRVARVGVGLAAAAFVVGVSTGGGWSLVASSSASVFAAGSGGQALTRVTACEVFALAEAKTLIGADATADPSDSHAVDFDGQRNTQCAYASGDSGLAVLQALIPLHREQAHAIRTAFANDKVTFRGTSVHGIGSAAFWKSKVGAPALYALTKSDVMFNLGATTNGTNSPSERRLEQVAIATVTALGASNTVSSSPGNGPRTKPPNLPAPPRQIGCYRYARANGWRQVKCLAAAYVKKRFGIPLAGTPGIQQGKQLAGGGFSQVGPSIVLSQLDAFSLHGPAVETDTTKGPGGYSLQDNTNTFVGTNGHNDWVQFVYQTTNGGTSGVACIWQIDLTLPNQQGYDPTGCASGGDLGSSDVNSGSPMCCIEGFELPGMLAMAVSDVAGSALAAVWPDLNGLEAGENWNQASGSILGVGGGSRAVFASGTEEQITVNASSCVSYGGFLTFPVGCQVQGFPGAGPPLKPNAFSSWPNVTAETNNLLPVIGNAPKHLPKLTWRHGGHEARVIVTETRSGHCLSGSAPLCS
jgi:hypothetical protein